MRTFNIFELSGMWTNWGLLIGIMICVKRDVFTLFGWFSGGAGQVLDSAHRAIAPPSRNRRDERVGRGMLRVHHALHGRPAHDDGHHWSQVRVHGADALPQARGATRRSVLPTYETNNEQQIDAARVVPARLETLLHRGGLLRLFRNLKTVPLQISRNRGLR